MREAGAGVRMSSSVMRHWSFGAALALGMVLTSCRLEKQPRPKVSPTPSTSTQTETASSQRAGSATVSLPSESSPSSRPAAAIRSSAHDILTLLRNLKDAADQNDHDGFNSDLAEARASASVLPSGTQKSGVDELLKTYGDLARVWDYAFASPSGSFFDEQTQNGSLLSTLRAYPGFDEYIARRTLVDPASGHRYYPSRETRDFLAAYAGQQLSRLGISAPTEIPRTASSVPSTSPTPTPAPPVASTAQRPPVSTTQRPSGTAPEQPSPGANSTPAVKRASSGSAAGSNSSSRKHSGRSVTTAKGSRSQSSGNHSAGNEKAAPVHPTASATRPPAIAASTTQVSPLDSLAAAASQRSTSTEPPPAPSTPSNTGSTGTASTTAIVTSTSTSTSGTTATDLLTPSSTDTTATATASEPSSSSTQGTPHRASGILTIIMVIVGIGVLALLIRASR